MSQVVFVTPLPARLGPPYFPDPGPDPNEIADLGTKTCSGCGCSFAPGSHVSIEDGEDPLDASTWTNPGCHPSCCEYPNPTPPAPNVPDNLPPPFVADPFEPYPE